MQTRFGTFWRSGSCLLAAIAIGLSWSSGCASGTNALSLLGSTPFSSVTGTGASSSSGSTTGQSSFFGTGSRVNIDPCAESNARKFVRVSMRNATTDAYVHYFLVLIAYVNGDTYPDGAVCPDDIGLYTSFGYTEIPEGQEQEFGNYCLEGPALIYFHLGGQFRRGGGTGSSQLGSAIAPAQGTNATFDNFFTSGGASVPVPNLIQFHNPGTGEGQALQISFAATSPCNDQAVILADSDCDQDGFYYVDDSDLITGSVALGVGSGRRVPSEIQGTGCECTGFQDPYQNLAPSGTAASAARCNEFLRGGLIEYVFVREDTNPPFPQLLWQISDQSGAEVHGFDSRAGLP